MNGRHIVFITARFHPVACGVGDYVRPLAHELVKRGWRVTIVTRRQNCPKEIDGIEIRQPVSRWNALNMPRLARELRGLKPDIVHVQYEPFGFKQSFAFVWLVSRLGLRVRTLATLHEVWHSNDFHRRRDRFLYNHMRHLIVPDAGRAEKLLAIAPSVRNRLSIIGGGSTLGGLENLPKNFKPAAEEPPVRVGYFGFFNKTKRLETLLDAFKKFSEASGSRATLELLGRFEPEKDRYHFELKNYAESLGLGPTVKFHGELPGPEVLMQLANCRFVVLPYIDGVSLRRSTFHVCAALGLPVITTKAQHNEPLIVDRVNALLIENLDAQNLSLAMIELAGDRALRQTLGASALAFSKRFSWSSIAEEHEKIYRRLLATNV